MCYFITIGLPEDKAHVLEAHIPRGFHVASVGNSSVLRQMGHGFCTCLLMSGGCSCDLFREPPTETEEDGHPLKDSEQERLRHKYEKMGWSAAKIERALAQRSRGGGAVPLIGLRGDVQRLLGDLARTAGQVAVLVHWYDGDVEEARFACQQGEVVSPEIAMEEHLRIEADEIARIKARP